MQVCDKPLKEIVSRRLAELDRNPYEAARKANLHRSYLNDIIIGRKESVRDITVPRLAHALDWTPEELLAAKRDQARVSINARASVASPPIETEPDTPEPDIEHTPGMSPELLEDWTEFFLDAVRADLPSPATADLIRRQVKIVLPIYEARRQYERLRDQFLSRKTLPQADDRKAEKAIPFDTATKPTI